MPRERLHGPPSTVRRHRVCVSNFVWVHAPNRADRNTRKNSQRVRARSTLRVWLVSGSHATETGGLHPETHEDADLPLDPGSPRLHWLRMVSHGPEGDIRVS